MIGSEIRTFLLSQPAITSLVGNRVYKVRPPQQPVDDYILYRRMPGTRRARDLDGNGGLVWAPYLFVARSTVDTQADEIAEAIRELLDGYGPGAIGDVLVHNVVLLDDADVDAIGGNDGSDVDVFSVTQIFEFQYTESIPNRR